MMITHGSIGARALWGAVTLAVLGSCSRDPAPIEMPPPPPAVITASGDAGGQSTQPPPPPEPECPPTNPFCKEPDQQVEPPPADCGSDDIDLEPKGINVMVAIDGSASMGPYWDDVRTAVARLRQLNPDINVGLHLFRGLPVEDFEQFTEAGNLCGETANDVLDVGPYAEDELLRFVGDQPPGADNAFLPSSPLVEPINYYLENDTALTDPTKTNYLVVLSDGVDNCFGSAFTNQADKRLALEKLAVELTKRNVRVMPISFVPGQEDGQADDAATLARMEALNTLAKFGGTGETEALAAESPEDLITAFEQVGTRIGNCRFHIPATLDPTQSTNPFELNFFVNGVAVERDRGNANGWNFAGLGTNEVEFFGDACQALRADGALHAQKSCSSEVCGNAAVQVETRPRASLFVLDASASRLECMGDDALACFRGRLGGGDQEVLSYWGVVKSALSTALIAPINDDVEFGLQMFPGTGFLSCEAADEPEVLPAPGTQITIMSSMFHRIPFGRSPLVLAMESVADDPGRLAEAEVSGAVIVLTDGGDNCTEGDDPDLVNQEILTRLEAAAGSLLEREVKTYVIRYGAPDSRTDQQEAELRAIVGAGGTATSDPADMSQLPYVDATDAEALTVALAEISDRLATCGFEIGELPEDADRDLANLYLNGALVPFDETGAQQAGWGWSASNPNEVLLFGEDCSSFKTNRKTSISMEFGCEQIVVPLI